LQRWHLLSAGVLQQSGSEDYAGTLEGDDLTGISLLLFGRKAVFNLLKSCLCVQDTSLTAIAATMALTGTGIWPWTSDMSQNFTDAMYQTMPVKPINIRVTNTQLEPNNRRRRQLLQVGISSPLSGCVPCMLAPDMRET